MKDERREDSCLRTGAQESIVALPIGIRPTSLLNRQGRSIIVGSFVFEPRVHTDSGVEIRVRCPHDAGHRSPGGYTGDINSIRVDVVLGDDFLGSTGDDRRFSAAPFLIGGLEPVPAIQRVCVQALLRVKDKERVPLGENVHPCADGEVFGILSTSVQHDDQGNGLFFVGTRDVQSVISRAVLVGGRAPGKGTFARTIEPCSPATGDTSKHQQGQGQQRGDLAQASLTESFSLHYMRFVYPAPVAYAAPCRRGGDGGPLRRVAEAL